MTMLRRPLALIAALILGSIPALADAPKPTLLVVGLEFLNVGDGPTVPENLSNIKPVQDEMVKLLEADGRYRLVFPSPDMAARIKARPNIPGCAGCQFDWGKEAGTDYVIWGSVNKVSNLILYINLNVDNVRTGQHDLVNSVDIRGDNLESWMHGVRYIVRHNLLNQ